ncbi:hypothetical protein BN2476_1150041 [Paraburkholderia piptadeniae]|uniref:Uncharacterized protein n=1 Tax=Paraburkholderia piptadeniae TaxID=1701573 RepID=A0A1N7SVD4_9BURK|nr:hypothetical protein BN2476_1150041 [Paraburkholderia piptadeniae]
MQHPSAWLVTPSSVVTLDSDYHPSINPDGDDDTDATYRCTTATVRNGDGGPSRASDAINTAYHCAATVTLLHRSDPLQQSSATLGGDSATSPPLAATVLHAQWC